MLNKEILIVDDEPDIREILQFNLESEGFGVETVASAEQALSLLEKDSYRQIGRASCRERV